MKINKNINANYFFKRTILFQNFLLLIINFYLLLPKNKQINKNIFYNFKSSDNFSMSLLNKLYREISDYLNDKYVFNHHSYLIKINFFNYFKSLTKKVIILYSVDFFNPEYHKEWLIIRLGEKFSIKYNKENPDYLLYNNFGNEHLDIKYKNSIKIAIISENRIPDLREADYAIGFFHINYLDRFFKYPILTDYYNMSEIKSIREKVLNMPIRKKFCAAVISNWKSGYMFRLNFINELSKYKKVDLGGKYNNNVGGAVINKIDFLSNYKFSIAMENSEGDGYTSEKIFQSYISGTIPIYYGNYMIDEVKKNRIYKKNR